MTPAQVFFTRYPRAAERLDARLREYFAMCTPEQQVELELADMFLTLLEATEGWRLQVAFKLEVGTLTLCSFDAASIGLYVIDGQPVYVDDDGVARDAH